MTESPHELGETRFDTKAKEAVMANLEVPDSNSRDVLLIVTPDPEGDSEESDRLTRQLRDELDELDVESVALLRSGEVPTGAKGEPLTMGALLVTLSTARGVFTALIETLRDWLGRHATADRISVTIDGDTLALDHATLQERRELIEAYVRSHATG